MRSVFAYEIKKQNWGSKPGPVHADKEGEGQAQWETLFHFANEGGKGSKIVTMAWFCAVRSEASLCDFDMCHQATGGML